MNRVRSWLLFLMLALVTASCPAASLEDGFNNPPETTKPWCYWYWISDNISRDGITRDLEAMKRVGIGEALIGNIFLDDVKIGSVKALSPEWWGMVEHAIREGGRIGVNVGMFNCPGWSQSGGPWIKPGEAMRFVTLSEQVVTGPQEFVRALPSPGEDVQPIAVLAFPEAELADASTARITTSPAMDNAGELVDGDTNTVVSLKTGPGEPRCTVDIEFQKPLTARSLTITLGRADFSLHCELQAERDGAFQTVRECPLDRSNNSTGVGFMPHAPLAVSFPSVTSKKFRLVFTRFRREPVLAEIQISGTPRVERYVEKQLGKMHPTPLPMWGDYLWPATTEPGSKDLVVSLERVVDISDRLGTDGVLRWKVPPGNWIILRAGMKPTGVQNAPASPEGKGLEVDKMNRAAAQAHFNAYVGKLLDRMPARDRKAFRHVIADSYETGSQNWTDGLREKFLARYAYDPIPWLPVLSGRIVASADQSDRFLWDLRRLVADQVAYEYVGGMRDACHKNGLTLWLENYGHWGFPAEFLQYGGQSDEVGGEFWSSGDLGSIELRAASSAAHIYGKPIVSAEAFTSGSKFESMPWSLKRRGDWALTEGVNHWVLHVFIHQPWEDKIPGVNAWFSTEFNRHNPWFFSGREWIDYYRRCQFLLQQGRHVADVAYFIGEDTPKMTGIREPALPSGYDFDYINAEVIQKRLKIKNGRFVLPDGMSYRLLVLPDLQTMRPELLGKLSDLVAAGGCILGPPPSRSPSRQNYPKADQRVRSLAAALWKDCDGITSKESRFGKGRVFRNRQLDQVLQALGVAPAISGIDGAALWTHRSAPDSDIFFLSNQADKPVRITPSFRVKNKAPEFWDPASKAVDFPAVFEPVGDRVKVLVELEPRGSMFVVFRRDIGRGVFATEVSLDGKTLAASSIEPPAPVSAAASRDTTNSFTIAAWVRPSGRIGLPAQTNDGVFIAQPRNDLVTPPHGASAFSNPDHSCAGVSVGQNGVVVYEHSGNYFAPLLSHPVDISAWTHVVVVYEEARPTLYINGKKAHEGVRSRFTVHSGLAVDPGASASFKGAVDALSTYAKPLDSDALAVLVAAKPAVGDSPLNPFKLQRHDAEALIADVTQPGDYLVRCSDGSTRAIEVVLPPTLTVQGPWQVGFPPHRDVPTRMEFPELVSLTEHSNMAVRYFSGEVTYQGAWEFPAAQLGDDLKWLLDLGTVEGVAEVALNGQTIATLWKPPFIAEIGSALRAGRNELTVRVTGTWRNRLIGAAKFPKGFPDASGITQALEFEPFLTADIKANPNEPLTPFGLIGPVRVHPSKVARLPRP